MKYKKGDTLEFEGGPIGLVLDHGMAGQEFIVKYKGKMISYIPTHNRGVQRRTPDKDWEWVVDGRSQLIKGLETVWYDVLIGDQRGWMELDSLEVIRVEGEQQ